MFTGIIEEIGEILAVQRNTASMILTIKAQKFWMTSRLATAWQRTVSA